jgi:hypothetical protein
MGFQGWDILKAQASLTDIKDGVINDPSLVSEATKNIIATAAKEIDKFFSFCDKDSTILHVRFIHSFCKEKRSAMDCIIINKGDESKLPLANTVLMYSDFQDRDDDFDSLYNRLR